ncbi:MAG: response regulator [Kiloniellales bacterium]
MHLVVADDHRLVLDALKLYLTKLRSDIMVSEATSLDEALRKLEAADDVDLVLLDLQMPGMNGLEGLATMKRRFPTLPVVMLSGVADAAQVRAALDQGAAGFIPKGLSGRTMLKALELVLSGEVFVPSMAPDEADREQSGQGSAGQGGRASPPPGGFPPDNPLSQLTPRESEVLGLLVKGFPNKEIARALGLKDSTAAFYLKNVFKKIEVSSRTEAVIKALKLGWTL